MMFVLVNNLQRCNKSTPEVSIVIWNWCHLTKMKN